MPNMPAAPAPQATAPKTLADIVRDRPDPDAAVSCPFYAEFRGAQVRVTAVLVRTAVYEFEVDGDRWVALLEESVPASEVQWSMPTGRTRAASSRRGRQVVAAQVASRHPKGVYRRTPR